MSRPSARDGTEFGKVRAPIDTEKLLPYLERNLPGWQGPLEVKQFEFGQSNPTYLLQTPAKSYVLRRAPVGKLLSSTAHRVDREHLILERLNEWNRNLPADKVNRRVPVPQVFCLCTDPSVAGAPFYVMEYLKGRIFTDVLLPNLEQPQREAIWRGCVRALTLLHTVPLEQLNLPSTFAPEPATKPYFPRQVKSMLRVSASQGATSLDDSPTGILGDIWGTDELVPYFKRGAVQVARADSMHGPSVVHGDYKLDNMVFHPSEPRVIGILDWELCTVGSPLADLGNMTIPFNIPPPAAHASAHKKHPGSNYNGVGGLSSAVTGIPVRDDIECWWVQGMNEGYAIQGVNREPWSFPIPHMPWVRSWMLFRLAIILQGVAARAALGQASSAFATTSRDSMNFFGKRAADARREGDDEQCPSKL